MDVFNQNWNQQIKQNPFVNKILNNTKPDRIRVKFLRTSMRPTGARIGRRTYREWRFFTFEKQQEIKDKIAHDTPLPELQDARIPYQYYFDYRTKKDGHVVSSPSYHYN